MNGFVSGLLLGLSLIIAIGAQNAFVLKQGLRQEHVFWVCFICSASDALLIVTGVYGLSTIIGYMPFITPLARYGGALFLLVYGVKSFIAAIRVKEGLWVEKHTAVSLKQCVITCLSLTWLNPHVYLDTVLLLGSISTQYPGEQLFFALGATLASFLFFFCVGYGARLVAPLFSQPKCWRILDIIIAVIMWKIAFGLLFYDPQTLSS